VLALTATASPPVREEILERLNMRDPQVIMTSAIPSIRIIKKSGEPGAAGNRRPLCSFITRRTSQCSIF
jgi:superfamily II DNA helicase RecQ